MIVLWATARTIANHGLFIGFIIYANKKDKNSMRLGIHIITELLKIEIHDNIWKQIPLVYIYYQVNTAYILGE